MNNANPRISFTIWGKNLHKIKQVICRICLKLQAKKKSELQNINSYTDINDDTAANSQVTIRKLD